MRGRILHSTLYEMVTDQSLFEALYLYNVSVEELELVS